MKKLFIDIPAFLDTGVSADKIACDYIFHRNNKGAVNILEAAEFSIYCRECKDSFCTAACPKEALEHQENGTIKRYNMRCVGCKSCTLACPFGTIFPEVMNYISSKCDFCLNQLNKDNNYVPGCVKSSPNNSFQVIEIEKEDPAKNIFFIGDYLAVKSHNWLYKEGKR